MVWTALRMSMLIAAAIAAAVASSAKGASRSYNETLGPLSFDGRFILRQQREAPASASPPAHDRTLSVDERVLANAAVVLKSMYLTRAWRLDVRSADAAILYGGPTEIDVKRLPHCVFEIGRYRDDRLAAGVQLYAANLTGSYRDVCDAHRFCRREMAANGAAACFLNVGARGWSCLRIAVLHLPDSDDRQRALFAALNYVWANGCPPSIDKPPF